MTANKLNNTDKFIKDIQDLLKNYYEYFENKQVKQFNNNLLLRYGIKLTPSKINETDRKQLEAAFSPAKERFHVDRAITYAEKKLTGNKFVELLLNLGQVCIAHGKFNFANEILTKARKISADKKLTAEINLSFGDLYGRITDFDKSKKYTQKAKTQFADINNKLGVAKSDNSLGTLYAEFGNLKKAKQYFEKSLENVDQEKNKDMIGLLEGNIAIIYNIYKEHDLAVTHFKKALKIFQDLKLNRRIAEIKHNLGMVYADQKYYHSALNELDDSIEISIGEGLKSILGLSYLSKANILIELQEYKFAKAFANKALEVSHETDDKLTIADVYKALGKIEINLQNYSLAENYLLSCLRINKSNNNQINIAEVSFELAKIYNLMNKEVERDIYANAAIKYYVKIEARSKVNEIEELFKTEGILTV